VSYTAFLSLLMVTFACIGFVLAIVMGRLGRSPFAWGLLGLLLGPIALLLALVEVRSERPWWTRLVASGVPGSGPVDVLVGIDGSPESAAATTAALELLGDRVGRLTLVAVTEVDDSTAGHQERARLRDELERQAEAVRAWLQERDATGQAQQKVTPELQLLSGPPARTLDTIAAEDGYGLLVVGARGAGMSSVLLGSVATRLAARASVPVLIIGDRCSWATSGTSGRRRLSRRTASSSTRVTARLSLLDDNSGTSVNSRDARRRGGRRTRAARSGCRAAHGSCEWGGGEVVAHSRLLPSQGSSPAASPRRTDRQEFQRNTRKEGLERIGPAVRRLSRQGRWALHGAPCPGRAAPSVRRRQRPAATTRTGCGGGP
jgi:nucleotide-binding universal stress UspA family protein